MGAKNYISRKAAKGAKVMGLRPSSRANARDLRKISPFGRNDTARAWRPFGSAQDRLGAQTFFITSVGSI